MTGARMTMPDAIPPPGTPADVYPDLKPRRERLIELIDHHLPTVKAFMAASDGIYSIDLFMVGVANRSFYLATGFIDALDQWNIYAAAPLVRLQTDSLLRVSYMVRAPRADHVVDAVLQGTEFRKLRDTNGKLLTDRHLVDLAAPHHPWIRSVYADSNEWIHLSRLQVVSTFKISKRTGGHTLKGSFPTGRESIQQRFLIGMVDAIAEATDCLLTYMEIWRRRKGLPSGRDRP